MKQTTGGGGRQEGSKAVRGGALRFVLVWMVPWGAVAAAGAAGAGGAAVVAGGAGAGGLGGAVGAAGVVGAAGAARTGGATNAAGDNGTGAAGRDGTAGDSQDPLELQHARANWLKSKAGQGRYSEHFDLSGLPPYRPSQRVSGTLRHWGSNYLADSELARYLEEGFRRYHPDVKFEDNLQSTFIGMASLYMHRADIAAMGRRATWDEMQAFQRVFDSPPVEIAMATGSLDVPGWTFALVVFVNRDNPISQLSLAQLDGIFGAQRDGGWKGNEWDSTAARGPQNNIRTWGQLGLKGEWADKPIHVYGYNLNYHFPRDFAEKVMQGGYKWNEQLREFSNAASPDGKSLLSAGTALGRAVGEDRYGITYTCIHYATPQVKTVALAASPNGPYVMPTLSSVQDRSYPLAREVYYYAARAPGKALDPLVKEYLRYVLSREGQEAIQRDGKYLPLTAEVAQRELRKLDGVGPVGRASE